ncbi:ribosomal protection-like ABC-F family protein [Evansella sp. AB-rgal1]|uniref:ribosomal protection-like ABC-F family protein n=1 Tax=Evansella sp. AB-rgal1 TaxID=3242696 RepID=UPI00359DB6B4
MKELLKLSNVSYEIVDNTIFQDINASVQQGDIIGIIGKNGAGKTSLLEMIHEDIHPSKGQIQWLEQDMKIIMVEQETEFHFSKEKTPLEKKLRENWHVPNVDFPHLSGGEKRKARLATGFSEKGDLLLLDEPTNHLDDGSLQLLQKEMKNYHGTILLVSHDRYFLDAVATKIWSLEEKTLVEFKGNYSQYMEHRRQKRLSQQRKYEQQQKMVERIDGQMKELTSWSKKAHGQSTKKDGMKEYYRVKAKKMDAQVKSKQKRLEKELERVKVERVTPEYTVQFSMRANDKVGKRLLEVTNISKSFHERTLFKNVSFTIQHGEKVAIVGPNGSGKTTLLNIINGMETSEGDVWISPTANIGYLTQEVFDLPLEQTPAQLFYQETFEARGKVQNLMKHLGFTASQWTEPVQEMSMGERVKCKLMKYILEEKDALILDEPTNHLDLPSREQLEETLSQYDGTLLVVSHDRYFLEKTTSTRYVISNQKIQRQWNDEPLKRDDLDELRLTLETERQEALGKLSFMTPNEKEYKKLDEKFKELTRKIKNLNKKH